MSEKHINAKPLSEVEKNLCEIVDSKKDELIQLLRDMIKFKSVSYDPDTFSDLSDIFNFVKDFMEKFGCNTKFYYCPHPGSEDSKDKQWINLIASYSGNEPGKTLQFMGHLDVVPFIEEKWSKEISPLDSVVKDGKIFGRGSADMKGGIAAQIMAMKILKESNISLNGKMQMWFAPDEEIDGVYGARFMSSNHNDVVNADATIISESTGQPPIKSPAIIVGEKGHQWLRFKVYGSAGHGSMPKPKSNAINKTVKFIQNVKKLKLPKVKPPMGIKALLSGILSRYTIKDLLKALKETDGEPDIYNEDGAGIGSFFKSTISFAQFHAGTKVNVIPDLAEFEIDIRVLPGITTQEVFDSLANYCTKLGYRLKLPEGYSNPQENNKKIMSRPIDFDCSVIALTPGTFVDPNEFTFLLSDAFEDVYNVKSVFFFAPGSTDAVHMRAKGIDNVVIFGPTGSNAHDSDEYVYVEHLIKTCKVYLVTAYRMLCKDANWKPDL